uniref:(northern house mosquito) hypothetical protein n=1 Tax=Culex pipiens TaxID=7175 RepID=A0A8D8BT50_CULPI
MILDICWCTWTNSGVGSRSNRKSCMTSQKIRDRSANSALLGSPLPLGGGDDGPSGLVAEQLSGGVSGGDLGGSTMNRCAIRCRTFWLQSVFSASWLSWFSCSELVLLLFPPAVAAVTAAPTGIAGPLLLLLLVVVVVLPPPPPLELELELLLAELLLPALLPELPPLLLPPETLLLWLLAALLVAVLVAVVAAGEDAEPPIPPASSSDCASS